MNLTALPQLLVSWLKTQGTELLTSGKNAPATHKETFQPGASYQGKEIGRASCRERV